MGCVSSHPDKTAYSPSSGLSLNASKYAYVDAVMNKARQSGSTSPSHAPSSALIRAKTGGPEEEPLTDVSKQSPILTAAVAPSKLRTDVKLSDIYKLGKTIGTGGFSIVKLATDRKSGEQFACKIMSLPTTMDVRNVDQNNRDAAYIEMESLCENSREDIFKEINIQGNLHHDNIIHLKEYFEENNKVFLITELLTGGELLEAVLKHGSYHESDARLCFTQLLKGIQYLHSRGVVHRDLKLENLLLKSEGDMTHVKIADFGLAKKLVGEGAMQTVCGTPQYVAPEVIQGHKDTQYGPGVDMWSAGVVLFILLGGYPPFYSDSEPKLFQLIRKGKYSFQDPVWKGISSSARDLIRKLLDVDPAKRLSASQALKHPWLQASDVDSSKGQDALLSATCDNLKKHFSQRMGNL